MQKNGEDPQGGDREEKAALLLQGLQLPFHYRKSGQKNDG
jgi:hypothetical protein